MGGAHLEGRVQGIVDEYRVKKKKKKKEKGKDGVCEAV